MKLKYYNIYLHLRYSRGRCQKLILRKRSFSRERRTGRRYGRGKRKIPDTENESEQHHHWALHTAVPKTLSSRHKRCGEGPLSSVKEPGGGSYPWGVSGQSVTRATHPSRSSPHCRNEHSSQHPYCNLLLQSSQTNQTKHHAPSIHNYNNISIFQYFVFWLNLGTPIVYDTIIC